MKEINDIRHFYDVRRDAAAVQRILNSRPPPKTSDINSTGLDCLTTVLRVIYAYTMLKPRSTDCN